MKYRNLLATAAMMLAAGSTFAASESQFIGHWVNTKSVKRTLDIEKQGQQFMIRDTHPDFARGQPETKNIPAIMTNEGMLQAQMGMGPINFAIDEKTGLLIVGRLEYKKSR